jgi:undecaprenyl-diphosphatase
MKKMTNSEANITVFRAVNDIGKEYPDINPLFIFFAEYTVYCLILVLLFYWLTRKTENKLMVVSAVISFFIAEVTGKLIGLLYSHHQPFAVWSNVNKLIEKEVGNSFPSDHTIVFFSVCISIALFRRRFWYLWASLALLLSISRIYVGVHYPVDILVGAVLGIVASILVHKIIPKQKWIRQSIALYEKGESYLFDRNKSI